MNTIDTVSDDARILAIKEVVLQTLQAMFKLDPGLVSRIDSSANLFDQIGIDSLQAFEAIITLHDIIEEEIPRDIDPNTISTLDTLAVYLDTHYSREHLQSLFDKDIAAILEERSNSLDSL
ncbi:MAG TPA: hypothetical protein VK196_06065 [Magnetospirillum sp.]|nr:hypothetical protein [Magnetospirillum sp.]